MVLEVEVHKVRSYEEALPPGQYRGCGQAALQDPHKSNRRVALELTVQDGCLHLHVEDEGAGFEYAEFEQLQPQDILMREYGRGIMMIRFSMDAVTWNEQRNRIEMCKVLSA